MTNRTVVLRLKRLEAEAQPKARSNVFRSHEEHDAAVRGGQFPALAPFCVLPGKAGTTAEWLFDCATGVGSKL